jgi:FkbM family methyltransferase
MLRRSGVAVCLVAELLEWRPDTILQIGVGLHHEECEAFKEAWPKVKLVGCDPEPGIAKNLRKIYPGEFHEVGMGQYVHNNILHSEPKHKDGATLFIPSEGSEKCQTYEVRIDTIDSYFGKMKQWWGEVLLWLDCEGSEMNALMGGKEFIEREVKVVNVEMTAKPRGVGWGTPFEIHNWLKDSGFKRQWVHTQRSCRGQYDAIYVRPELFLACYSCCPCQVEDC